MSTIYAIERLEGDNLSGRFVGDDDDGTLGRNVEWPKAYKFYDEESAVHLLSTLVVEADAFFSVTEHEEVDMEKEIEVAAVVPSSRDIIETIEDEMVCANECPVKGKAPYDIGTCNCYKRETIREIIRLIIVEHKIKDIIDQCNV